MEKTFDIKELLDLFLKRIIIIAACGLIGGVALYVVSAYFVTPQYTSATRLYVNNNNAVKMDRIQNADIAASQELVSTYAIILQDSDVLQQAADLVGGGITGDRIRRMISVSSVNSTEIMEIRTTSSDPELSAKVSNAVANIAPSVLKRVVKAGSVEVIGTAKVPRVPSSPNVSRNSIIGIMFGVLLSMGIIFMIQFFDNTVKGEDDLKIRYNIPVLGEIPDLLMHHGVKSNKKIPLISNYLNFIRNLFNSKSKGLDNKKDIDLTIKDDTPFHIKEAYKTVRTNLTFALGTSEKKIVEISSAIQSEYKSTTSCNMALTIAETGAKVLLIDADMRKPTQHKLSRLNNSKGLSSVLAGIDKLEESIHKNVDNNLDILPSGPIPPNPSELLSSDNMKNLLEELDKTYDIILIDTPPINIVTDALSLSKYTTGIIVMARQNQTQYEELNSVISSIEFANVNLLGMILVSWRQGDKSYSKYKYKYKYKYEYGNSGGSV